jgi:hypothetical protein
VSWSPEDWEDWLRDDGAGTFCEPVHLRIVQDVLSRLPDREHKVVADLSRDAGPLFHWIADRFGRAVLLDVESMSREPRPEPARPRYDVVVAIDAITVSAGTDALLSRIGALLVEGGVLVATFPARPAGKRPFSMRLGGADAATAAAPWHEVELQYRLRRSGFQGLRMRRVGGAGGPAALVCMAVRRALN